MNLKHFQNTARQSFWVVHMEAWRRSGLARTAYCRHQRLNRRTFDRWMNYLLGKESASRAVPYKIDHILSWRGMQRMRIGRSWSETRRWPHTNYQRCKLLA